MAITALPAGWSLLASCSREDLHQALLTSTGDLAFDDVPVDCWDESAEVWRPTSINRVLGGVWDVGRDVEVLTPGVDTTSLRRVSIARVRLSRLLTAGVSRYWVTRYQRRLVLRLIEQAAVGADDLASLRRLENRLRHEESLGYDIWATAYRAGAPEHRCYEPEVPPMGDDAGLEPAGDVDGAVLIRTAVDILAADLLRLDASLEEAGATAAERARHPLLVLITSLLLRSPVVQAPVSRAGSDPRPA
jgi:hypothetical protein